MVTVFWILVAVVVSCDLVFWMLSERYGFGRVYDGFGFRFVVGVGALGLSV